MQTDILQSAVEVVEIARQEGRLGVTDTFVVEIEKTGVGLFRDAYTIMTKGNYKLAKYKEAEQIVRFLEALDIQLQPVMTRQTRHHGEVTILKLPKEFKLELVNSPKKFPKTSITKVFRGIMSERVVDVAIDVQENEVVVYKPKPVCIRNGFNEASGVSEFFKANGSLNVIRS
ncbi:hypothetical protein P9X10_01200 [Bacillus cereus]|nr:hypothetical protein [Bacillus cereus]